MIRRSVNSPSERVVLPPFHLTFSTIRKRSSHPLESGYSSRQSVQRFVAPQCYTELLGSGPAFGLRDGNAYDPLPLKLHRNDQSTRGTSDVRTEIYRGSVVIDVDHLIRPSEALSILTCNSAYLRVLACGESRRVRWEYNHLDPVPSLESACAQRGKDRGQ